MKNSYEVPEMVIIEFKESVKTEDSREWGPIFDMPEGEEPVKW